MLKASDQHRPHRIVKHPDTWTPIDRLGRESRPYCPTYDEFSGTIDDFHSYLANCKLDGLLIDLGIPGWLQSADALKLYELGYFASGDILEFGTHCGLSTFVLAKSIQSSGRSAQIVTMELDSEAAQLAKANLSSRSLKEFVDFRIGDAGITCARLIEEGRQFSFAFVDHSHAYEPMMVACRSIPQLLSKGAFCLFHDFNDPRNTTTTGIGDSGEDYGVFAAVQTALDREKFEFFGIYGCCGLYRKIG